MLKGFKIFEFSSLFFSNFHIHFILDRADIGSPAAAHHTNYFSEDDDEEYLPPDPYRKQIRIGPFFQAVIPGFANVVEEGESDFLVITIFNYKKNVFYSLSAHF